ncbi:hypothetical protein [Paenibacillus sp. FSL H7-0331]|uniref:hypothetical protein n=1 Tax=Paenibacillus sp. FSL H7-0331 TaxID=1920421 RepID=UPI00097007F2|nr:hypothetical protein [Paenibacillus sp. FSL H7-0331]OMF11015.1 hypothetical protein BK127_25965 [Paenibacillus sp. FSL H7-0331]
MWTFISFMSFMAFLACLIGGIVSTFQKNGLHTKYFILTGSLLVLFILLVIASPKTSTDSNIVASVAPVPAPGKAELDAATKSASAEKSQAKLKSETEAKKKVEQKNNNLPVSLGMYPEQFQVVFNDIAGKFQPVFNIDSINVEEGNAVNAFSYMLKDELGIIGLVNKHDGNLQSLAIAGKEDGSIDTTKALTTAIHVLIKVTNVTMSSKEISALMDDLGIFDGNAKNLNKSIILNGVRYSTGYTEKFGVSLMISNANDANYAR